MRSVIRSQTKAFRSKHAHVGAALAFGFQYTRLVTLPIAHQRETVLPPLDSQAPVPAAGSVNEADAMLWSVRAVAEPGPCAPNVPAVKPKESRNSRAPLTVLVSQTGNEDG